MKHIRPDGGNTLSESRRSGAGRNPYLCSLSARWAAPFTEGLLWAAAVATKLPVTEPGLLLPQLTPLRRCHALTSFLTLPIPARSEG